MRTGTRWPPAATTKDPGAAGPRGPGRRPAGPEGSRPLPPQPAAGAAHDEVIAFWSPLLHLTSYGLGWNDIGGGLLQWLESGADTSDPRLALIHRWWNPVLPDFLAYGQGEGDLPLRGGFICQAVGGPAPRTRKRATPSDDLARLMQQRREDGGWQQTWAGGSDPLHLNGHSLTPVQRQPAPGAVVRLAIEGPARAIITTNRYDGWYSALAEHGAGLAPTPDGRSWRISVFCLPVGYLGTYRLSRESGRWFAGQHRWHQLGA